MADDRKQRHTYRLVLLGTFVERDLFRGTCYHAANWIHVGHIHGRGKLDCHNRHDKPVKEIFLCPLVNSVREAPAESPDGFGE